MGHQRQKSHYVIKLWPKRESLLPGEITVSNTTLLNPGKVYLPPLHIKLKNVLGHENFYKKSGAFRYLKSKFPKVSDGKLEESILIGPKIRSLIHDEHFEELLNQLKKQPGSHSKLSVPIFLKIIKQKTIMI